MRGGARKKAGRKPRAGVAATERIMLRLTPAEHVRLEAAAKRLRMTVSEFVRLAALDDAARQNYLASLAKLRRP